MGLIFFLLIDSGFLFHGRSHGLKANKKKQTRSDLAAMLLPRLELFFGMQNGRPAFCVLLFLCVSGQALRRSSASAEAVSIDEDDGLINYTPGGLAAAPLTRRFPAFSCLSTAALLCQMSFLFS